jgi:hypothetical protein
MHRSTGKPQHTTDHAACIVYSMVLLQDVQHTMVHILSVRALPAHAAGVLIYMLSRNITVLRFALGLTYVGTGVEVFTDQMACQHYMCATTAFQLSTL